MICEKCAEIGDLNRRLFNGRQNKSNTSSAGYPHPKKCGCACQHRKPTKWVKFFSVEEPNEKDS